MINPNDDEIMAVVRERPNLPTYVIKNHLRSQFRGLATSFVLRRLNALEVAAKVRRTGTSSNSITWKITETV